MYMHYIMKLAFKKHNILLVVLWSSQHLGFWLLAAPKRDKDPNSSRRNLSVTPMARGDNKFSAGSFFSASLLNLPKPRAPGAGFFGQFFVGGSSAFCARNRVGHNNVISVIFCLYVRKL